MIDIEDMRKRYAPIGARTCVVCGGPTAEMSASGGLVVIGCTAPRNIDTDAFEAEHYRKSLQTVPASLPTGDPSVLALCDEVEALRAKVAAAPEVLREWPAKMEDAPGQWAHFTQDEGIRVGRFLSLPHMGGEFVVFERTNNRTIRLPDAFRPVEFFVRAPE